MRHYKVGFVLLLGVALVTTGCFKKKAAEQANLNLAGGGVDSLSSTEELSQQLPAAPAAGAPNQQTSVEVLPIETTPVTQPATATAASTGQAAAPAASASSGSALSYNQKVQTALRNAGLYTGAIDGKIGPASRKAIEAFQGQNGLTADGKAGSKTWAALEPYYSGKAGAQTGAAAGQGTQTAADN